jgi:hypothetical protein
MRSELLDVVACVANPVREKARIALALPFIDHMIASGVRLTIVECAYGERPFDLVPSTPAAFTHIGVRAAGNTLMWNKESLLQIGLERLPDDAKYVCFWDADVHCRNPDWAAEVVHALQHHEVVQPWSNCLDMGSHGEVLEVHTALFRLYREGHQIVQGPNVGRVPYKFGHPGFGLAFTMRALDRLGGLITTAALGAADHHQCMALLSRVEDSIPRAMTAGYKAPLRAWQARADRFIHKNVSFIHNVIEHGFHGEKAARAYVSRWDILIKNGFDPAWDIKRNRYGVLELAGNKPELRHEIDLYFRRRDGDRPSTAIA